jgi:hypothetical protein
MPPSSDLPDYVNLHQMMRKSTFARIVRRNNPRFSYRAGNSAAGHAGGAKSLRLLDSSRL